MSVKAADVIAEFERVHLGDERLNRRLRTMLASAARRPLASFPKLFRSSSKLEGCYRWCANESFDAADVLRPHVSNTLGRAHRAGRVRVVHDTTDIAYRGDREDLGIIEGDVQGYFAHVSLAVGSTEDREPLGILHLATHINKRTEERRALTRTERDMLGRNTPRKRKKSHRWETSAMSVDSELDPSLERVHVMDVEADDFVVYAELASADVPFVIRTRVTRSAGPGLTLDDVLAHEPSHIFRSVHLEARGKAKIGKRDQARPERDANLSVRFGEVTLPRSSSAQTDVRELHLYCVIVEETDPPDDQQPVHWILVTNTTVLNLPDATRVIDDYRARWLVEELFKALKTGCAIEKRQLTNYHALTKVLAMYLPIAWQMLRLRHLERSAPDRPGTDVLSKDELKILRAALAYEECDYELRKEPTVGDVLNAIARLGGHLKRNGPPGWITIGRGYEDFLSFQAAWQAAKADEM